MEFSRSVADIAWPSFAGIGRWSERTVGAASRTGFTALVDLSVSTATSFAPPA
jgi:hypothetical protein